MLVQGDRTGDTSLLDIARGYIKEKFAKPGNVYLGLVHRLDRPVSGVIVLARTSKSAARLSEQFRSRNVRKIYWAIVQGNVSKSGTLEDRIVRKSATSHISKSKDGQQALLTYQRLDYNKGFSWVEIELGTGRHHQIRVQFSSRGYPIVGDWRYGSEVTFGQKALALHARSLTITHPTKHEMMIFSAEPESAWQDYFSGISTINTEKSARMIYSKNPPSSQP